MPAPRSATLTTSRSPSRRVATTIGASAGEYLIALPSKLINAWLAGCPGILGPESAFQQLRESELDYIEARTVDDIVNAVAGETGLPGKVVGTVDVREKHLFVDVASEHANGIIAKLNRASIKGHKVKVKVA